LTQSALHSDAKTIKPDVTFISSDRVSYALGANSLFFLNAFPFIDILYLYACITSPKVILTSYFLLGTFIDHVAVAQFNCKLSC
jgi:hypothetical protein